MAKYCDRCGQSWDEGDDGCRCGAGRPSRNGKHAAGGSDREIDLGSPITAPTTEPTGPPSGASFVSWAAHLRRKGRLPRDRRMPRLVPMAGDELGEVTIDLDQTPRPGDGPPSGASFTSWSALLPRASQSKSAPALTARRLIEPPAPAPSPAPPLVDRSWLAGAVLGAALGFVVCFLLWLAGVRPPEAWRGSLHLGPHHAAPAAPATAPE